jgi:hypothetical protein
MVRPALDLVFSNVNENKMNIIVINIVVLIKITTNVFRTCAGSISQTFAANRTQVQREDKDF